MSVNKKLTNKDRPVRVGVIGAGVMGRNHLRVYDILKNVELVGFYDPDVYSSRIVHEQFRCHEFHSIEEMIDSIEAVSICTSSSTHGEIGLKFLEAGIHCLIEKPLATTEKECLSLIEASNLSGAKLLVGHIERFNPAVQQLSILFDKNPKVYAVEARRLSSSSNRISDVDVVADLMVHDLDIVMALMKCKIVSVKANSVKVLDSSLGGDHVTALLRFENDAIANITASRITQNTIRELSVTTDAGLIEVDYMNQSVEVFLQDKVIKTGSNAARFGDYALDITMERVLVRRTEPLQLELSHFVNIVINDGKPMVTGEDGLEALRLVCRVQDCINT